MPNNIKIYILSFHLNPANSFEKFCVIINLYEFSTFFRNIIYFLSYKNLMSDTYYYCLIKNV